jgi:ATP-binding cassette, subfamily B, bacterial HlyB/CyaB
MLHEADKETKPLSGTGLDSLVMILRIHGIAADPAQLSHKFGPVIGTSEMLRCAKELHIKARVIDSNWERLARTALPAIAARRDGSFFVLGKMSGDTIVVQDPVIGRPQIMAII